jgi:hypothetical protein
MFDFGVAFATASQALKLVNDLRGVDKAFDQAQRKLKVAELVDTLSEVKTALLAAKDEIAAKQTEVDRLEALLVKRADLIELRGYKYDKTADGRATGLPYCPACEQLGTLMHLAKLGGQVLKCPKCNSVHRASVYR